MVNAEVNLPHTYSLPPHSLNYSLQLGNPLFKSKGEANYPDAVGGKEWRVPKLNFQDLFPCGITIIDGSADLAAKVSCKLKTTSGTSPEISFKIGWPKREEKSTLITALKIPGTDHAIIAVKAEDPNATLMGACTQSWLDGVLVRGFQAPFARPITIADSPDQTAYCMQALQKPTEVRIDTPSGQKTVNLTPDGSSNMGIFRVVELAGELYIVLGDPSIPKNLIPLSMLEKAMREQVQAVTNKKQPVIHISTGSVAIEPTVLASIPEPTPIVTPTVVTLNTPTAQPQILSSTIEGTTAEQNITIIKASFNLTADGKSKAYIVHDTEMADLLIKGALNPLTDPNILEKTMFDAVTADAWYSNIISKANSLKVESVTKTDRNFDGLRLVTMMTTPGAKDLTFVFVDQVGTPVVIETNAEEWLAGGKLNALNNQTNSLDSIGTGTLDKILGWIARYHLLATSTEKAAAVTVFPADRIPHSILDGQVDSLANRVRMTYPTIFGVIPDGKGGGIGVQLPTGTKGEIKMITCDQFNTCWAKITINPLNIPDYPPELREQLMEATGRTYFTVWVNLNNILKPDVPEKIFGSHMPTFEEALTLAQSGVSSIDLPDLDEKNKEMLRQMREGRKRHPKT